MNWNACFYDMVLEQTLILLFNKRNTITLSSSVQKIYDFKKSHLNVAKSKRVWLVSAKQEVNHTIDKGKVIILIYFTLEIYILE